MHSVDANIEPVGPSEVDRTGLPTFIIIGAAKAGTTSLHYYLAQHPSVSMSSQKETNFFTREDYLDAVDEYRRFFDPSKPCRGEASIWYTAHPYLEGVPQRIHALLPDVKLVYLVRDPVARAEGMYWERFASNRAPATVEEAFADVDDPRNLFVCGSRYALQLEQYLELFPRERLMIVDSRDLRVARGPTLRSIFSFIGVDPDFSAPAFERELNTAEAKRRTRSVQGPLKRSAAADAVRKVLPARLRHLLFGAVRHALSAPVRREPLSDASRARLAAALRDDAARFRALTGRPFEHWSV